MADEEQGRVLKVLFLDEQGQPAGEWASSQLPEDPFEGTGMRGLQDPPLKLEQLVYLAELHPVHSAALEQKTADTCGKGWDWVAVDPTAEPDAAEKDAIAAWFASMGPDDTDVHEEVTAAWSDKETVGWGLLEVTREPGGLARKLYHVPGHTVRAAKDGFRLCQIRGANKVWFRRWGAPEIGGKPIEIDSKTGWMKSVREQANDLLVIKSTSRRSTWYGIPGYVSAIGWITLALAARDDNLLFFSNRREPRWAIILENIQNDPHLEAELRRAFTVDLKQPHRNIIIPITGAGKINFKQMSDNNRQEGSFDRLSERADREIMIAHRVPGERLANSQVGPLGGNAVVAASKVYKEGVVNPGQELLAKRLNRFIAVEYEREFKRPATWKIEMDPLDTESDEEDLMLTERAFKADLLTLREARAKIKEEPLREADNKTESLLNDLLYSQLPGVSRTSDAITAPLRETRDLLLLERVDHELSELVRESREAGDRLERLARVGDDDRGDGFA